MAYGKEVILDLYDCDTDKFSRESIKQWLDELCVKIDMKQVQLHYWDYDGVAKEDVPLSDYHLVGTSAVQFISTSDIVIHTLDLLKECYINIFSCKDFDDKVAIEFTKEFFGAKDLESFSIVRGDRSVRCLRF